MTKSVLVLLTLCLAFAFFLTHPVQAAQPFCGDNKCTGGENATTCPADCEVGGGGTEDIPVCVEFRNAFDDQVQSPAALSYCDGDEGVKAKIVGITGGFVLDTTGKSPVRPVIENFPGCDDPDDFPLIEIDIEGNCLTPAHLFSRNGYLPNDPPGGATGGRLNLLAMGDGEIAHADFQINFPSDLSKNTPNVTIFGGSSNEPCGRPLTVTRSDPDTWMITNPDDAALEACLWKVISKNGKRDLREPGFNLPFEITITRE